MAGSTMNIVFDEPAQPMPRYIEVGKTYTDTATATYIDLLGRWVEGTFEYRTEVLKTVTDNLQGYPVDFVLFDLKQVVTLVREDGWSRTTMEGVALYAIAIGLGRIESVETVEDSDIDEPVVHHSELLLISTNVNFSGHPPIWEHRPNYNGVVYLEYPFAYSFSEMTWLYFWDTEMWVYDYGHRLWVKMGHLPEFLWVDAPLAYSFDTGTWFYIAKAHWIFDYGMTESYLWN